uniref:Immunoglobulin-binding protein 1 n=1 Tax=Amazona collaria TaxID=241587 RepID=A0A8B9GC52_9PSIT
MSQRHEEIYGYLGLAYPEESWAAAGTSVKSMCKQGTQVGVELRQELALWLHLTEFQEIGNCFRNHSIWAGLWKDRYKQKKELENRLASMKNSVDSGQSDEEQIQEFYMLQTQKWINTSLEEIESVDQEIVLLRSRDTSSAPPHSTSRQVRPPVKPFILTRDAVQAKVFGAGYPSLPVMTVDDWYDQRRRQGVVSGQTGLTDEELQKQQQEKKEEEDDEEALQKARNWDDWKDTHPRGYGNRHNMG